MSRKYFIFTTAAWVLVSACRGLYSFSSSSLHKDVKTFSVNFVNSPKSEAYFELPDQFIHLFKERLLTETDLIDAASAGDSSAHGDIHFEGVVMQYKKDDTSSLQKSVSIVVVVNYSNTVQKNASFQGKVYSASKALEKADEAEVNVKVQEICEEIVNKVLEESVNVW